MKITRFLLTSLMVITLAACGSDGDKDKDTDKKDEADKPAKVKEVTPICPQVAIIRDIDELQDYGTEKPDPSELVAEARMVGVTGNCEYQDKGVDITFDLNFVAIKGPRLGGLHTTFPYFVAVVDPQENILNKERMTLDVGFASDSKTQTTDESLHIFIPMLKADQKSGPYYQVLMGFQLTEDQLDAVKQKREAGDKKD